jgi:hypothetical protein
VDTFQFAEFLNIFSTGEMEKNKPKDPDGALSIPYFPHFRAHYSYY